MSFELQQNVIYVWYLDTALIDWTLKNWISRVSVHNYLPQQVHRSTPLMWSILREDFPSTLRMQESSS